MTEQKQLETFRDDVTEWRTLSALLDPENGEWMNRISPALFTGKRVDVFHAMQDSFIKYGSVTWEGIRNNHNGAVPNELAAAQGANIRATIDELARLARKRQAARVAATMNELAGQHDPQIDAIQSALIFDPIMAEEDSSLAPGAQALLSDLELKRKGLYKFTKSGIKFLDNSMGGEYKPKTLIVYAAAAGAGKTTLVCQSMLEMAEGYTVEATGEIIISPSLLISLEMAKEDLLLKWLGNRLEIDTQDIMAGRLTDEQFQQIEEKVIYFQRLPMYIIDKPEITLAQMVYEIKKHIFRYGVKVVFVDHLQIVNHQPTGNDNKDLGEFSLALRALAKRENITVMLLSQITPGKDGTFQIRDSGEVGNNADVVFKAELQTDEVGPLKPVVVKRLKNRLGPTGSVPLLFNGPYQRFEEGTV